MDGVGVNALNAHHSHAPLILASASPRRVDLLKQMGVVPSQIIPADIDETPMKGELPRALALRLSTQKAKTIAENASSVFILAADTVVAVGRRILPKADNNNDVAQCLELMSGRTHTVYTGVSLITPQGRQSTKVISTKVTFKRLTAFEKSLYIQSGEGLGKAGGYAVQGLAESYILTINGSYSAIVGLPLCAIRAMLDGVGFFNPR